MLKFFFQVIISHNNEFVSALCRLHSWILTFVSSNEAKGPEIWNVDAGRLTHQGKAAVIEDAFADKTPKGSGANTPVRSRLQTPAGSVNGTPAASGAEDNSGLRPVKKKKKMTRNQVKAQEERRRLRKLRWLQEGGLRPEDTDDDE